MRSMPTTRGGSGCVCVQLMDVDTEPSVVYNKHDRADLFVSFLSFLFHLLVAFWLLLIAIKSLPIFP